MKRVAYPFKRSQAFLKGRRALVLAIAAIVCFNIFFIITVYLALRPPKQTKATAVDYAAVAKSLAAGCSSNPDWRNCYGYRLAAMAKDHNLTYLTNTIYAIQKIDPKTQDCHILAHRAMNALVAKDPSKWQDLLDTVDPNACNYGFIHGILEARSQFDPSFVLNAKTIPSFCRMMVEHKPNSQGIDQTCAHIVGHLVLAQEYGNIPMAVSICNGIPESLQRECFGGLFMENYTRDNLVIHGIAKYVPWTDAYTKQQEDLCNKYSGMAGLGCWETISSLYTAKYFFQPDMIYASCQHASTQEYINQCYDFSMPVLMYKPDADQAYYASLCNRFADQPGEFEKCATTAVRSVVFAAKDAQKRAFDFCSSVPGNYKNLCYKILGRALTPMTTTSDQQELCANVEPMYQQDCMKRSM